MSESISEHDNCTGLCDGLFFRAVTSAPFALSLHQQLARSAIGVAHDDRAALFAVDLFAIQVVVSDDGGCSLVCLHFFYAGGLHNDDLILAPRVFRSIGSLGILVHHIDCF